MENKVFVIDDLGRVEAVLAKALAGSGLEVVPFSDIQSAKRQLIETTPFLILTLVTFQNSPDGGYRFAAEVSQHDALSSIPLLLISDELSEEVIRRASESRAASLLPWPVTVDSLKNRLQPFLPASAVVSTPQPAAVAQTPAAAQVSSDQKIQLAQQLLAKVLHNLKTSALLEVVDLEDVPRVVYEISRAVCGVKPAERAPERKGPSIGDEADTVLDLDRAFGFKK